MIIFDRIKCFLLTYTLYILYYTVYILTYTRVSDRIERAFRKLFQFVKKSNKFYFYMAYWYTLCYYCLRCWHHTDSIKVHFIYQISEVVWHAQVTKRIKIIGNYMTVETRYKEIWYNKLPDSNKLSQWNIFLCFVLFIEYWYHNISDITITKFPGPKDLVILSFYCILTGNFTQLDIADKDKFCASIFPLLFRSSFPFHFFFVYFTLPWYCYMFALFYISSFM